MIPITHPFRKVREKDGAPRKERMSGASAKRVYIDPTNDGY